MAANYDDFDDAYGSQPNKRRSKGDINALRKQVMQLREDNDSLRSALCEARKQLAESKATKMPTVKTERSYR